MAPILANVLKEILTSINMEAIMPVVEKPAGDFSLDSDSDEGEGVVTGVDIDQSFIDEKAAAVHALGNIFMNCSTLCFPNLPAMITGL